MRLQRLWNSYAPPLVKKNSSTVVIILCIIAVYLVWKFIWFKQDSLSYLCSSEENLKQASYYEKLGVHIIPSTPHRNRIQEKREGTSEELASASADCVPVMTPDGAHSLLTCIHDPAIDLMLSAHLKNKGAWEKENVASVYNAHQLFPNLVLVDLGCNVGAFTLPAAKHGIEVVAVDAVMPSLRLLQRSLLINDLSCPVTLIHNALYKSRKKMRVVIDPTNIGGSQVAEILDFRKDKIPPSQTVDAICLDDLVPFVRGRDVFLKLDLEGMEVQVLQCAQEFFSQVDVKVVLLEWMFYRHHEEASGILKSFLTSHGLSPTWGVNPDRVIDLDASHSWPDNVFWMKV
ncbi:uncharacterized protein LOC101860018 isoform X1 [Aplysia californica]|uniref:Uncharacterized protein LOC101860018 isoform X1 n=1 Tax=Aplysia californica TaxID=6500 RepID=A0ABM0JQA0_APLCA|nr:uncharacterized protein LOC101860018 isoform X1 [Aplysia californica]XP_005099017.1 uncharacterized protein LOC101860018 isoform X1 [Aplysia californica]